MNGTPIVDIKPYLAYTDSHPEAAGGFALTEKEGHMNVVIPDSIRTVFTAEKLNGLISVLSQDPRPQYQSDPDRVYTMSFGGAEVSFVVSENKVTVTDIQMS